MRTKTLCTSCEQYVYTDADHSCRDAKALRAVRDAEAAVVEAVETWYNAKNPIDARYALDYLRSNFRALHWARQGEGCE